ncbi:MAG: hypothetical protein RL701_790, partial [Pseudomonadota bacterium]
MRRVRWGSVVERSSSLMSLIKPMKRLRALSWAWLCTGFCASALLGCTLEERPATGGLVVVLDSDLSVPKDIDQVLFTVVQSGRETQHVDVPLLTALPREFRIQLSSDTSPVTVRAIASKGGVPRIERSVITTVPRDHLGVVRLPLSYLCDATATPTGDSTCGSGKTCKQGACDDATLVGTLPDYMRPTGPNASMSPDAGAANGTCFNTASCFGEATEMVPDPATCSFVLPTLFDERLNVALRLPLGGPGICDASACWVVFDSGSEGFRLLDGRVVLPLNVCTKRGLGENIRVAVTNRCPAKIASFPLCSPTNPDTSSGGTGGDPGGILTTPGPVGDACSGPAARACGNCGTSTRICQNGLWSVWSACAQEGLCQPDDPRMCGTSGLSMCGGDCMWGTCQNQQCPGAATESCGNCGTRRRTCSNGAWGEWSACENQGLCKPSAAQACGVGGTQVCGGSCQWGACSVQTCVGGATGPCGLMCGTQARTCDQATSQWSAWGACGSEGVCLPNEMRDCGAKGKQTCGGNCQWDAACAGQMCVGAAQEACGTMCGTRTRTCDTNTGMFAAWSACSEGACTPNTTRACGVGATGTQTCGGSCQWDAACTGQTCVGESTRACGNCGTESRTCNTNTGNWRQWGGCSNEGVCVPNATQICGEGTRTCGSACTWNRCACPAGTVLNSAMTACVKVPTGGAGGAGAGGAGSGGSTPMGCTGSDEESCGRCLSGTHKRTCNASTGMWNAWPTTCSGETGCVPGTTSSTGCKLTGAVNTCTNACTPGPCACPIGQAPNDADTACVTPPMMCTGLDTEACGRCLSGTHKRTCNPSNGMWNAWPTTCSGETG